MNQLYFIAAHNPDGNVWRRFLVSGPNAFAITQDFDEYIAGSGWERKRSVYVSKTPDIVFMEL